MTVISSPLFGNTISHFLSQVTLAHLSTHVHAGCFRASVKSTAITFQGSWAPVQADKQASPLAAAEAEAPLLLFMVFIVFMVFVLEPALKQNICVQAHRPMEHLQVLQSIFLVSPSLHSETRPTLLLLLLLLLLLSPGHLMFLLPKSSPCIFSPSTASPLGLTQ